MIILDKTVISATEPPQTSVLWVKPVEGGVAHYAFIDGKWRVLKVMDDMGTPQIDDDKVSDISNINQIVETEVTRQVADITSPENDTHNAPSSDDNDYPDLTLY